MEKAKNPRHKSPPGSRDRSVSMNHAAETPPAKKHRASDDEGDSAALIGSAPGSQDARLPPPTPTICVGQKATTTSPQNWKDATEDAAATASATAAMAAASMDHQAPRTTVATDAQVASSSPLSSTSSPAGSATSSPQATGSTTATAAAAATTTASTSGTTTPSGPNGDITEESFMAWLMEQKQQGVVASQMLDVLGLGVSEGTAIDDDELWDAILSMGMRLIQPSIPVRQKLEHVNTIQDVVALLQQAKKIVVLAGAGISVSCGIPDFRSENGIYSRLGEYNLPNPQCMFDIEFFRTNPRPFFAFAKELFPKANGFTFVPSRSHYFLKLLEEKGKLLRVYSQNIDMLEHAAGLSHERSILCHGSFATATCLACKRMFPGDAIRDDVMRQQVPMCKSCGAENGIVKPDIVFFGESLPRRFHDLIKADENEADLVLVMGSSLKVNPVRSLVGRIHNKAPMILINREPVGRPHKFDVELLGYSDEIVEELCRHLGWEIPKPDPVLLGQSNLTYNLDSLNKNKEPLPFEFFPPSRHMFNGSKSSSPSSSEVEDNDDSVDTSSSQDEDDGFSSSGRVRMSLDVGIDEPDFRAMNGVVVGDDDDQLMGSGSEMLRNSTFEEDGDL